MPSTYSDLLRIELMANGEQDSTWGTKTNTNLDTVLEDAIAGRAAVSMGADANYTLTANNAAVDEARMAIVNVASGVALTATRDVIVPTSSKVYQSFKNATTGGQSIRVKTTAGTGITIPTGKTGHLICDGTNVTDAFDWISTLTVGSGLTVTAGGLTVTAGATTISGSLTASPANANVVFSPTGSGVVTINPATAGTLNNVAIGGTTPLAGAFTTLSATGTSTLAAVNQSGDYNINAGKFTVAAASGNTVVAGTLGVTGKVGVNGASTAGLALNLSNTDYVAWYTTGSSGGQIAGIRGNGGNLELTASSTTTIAAGVVLRVNTDASWTSTSAIMTGVSGTSDPRLKFYRPVGDGTTSYPGCIELSGVNSKSEFRFYTGASAAIGSETLVEQVRIVHTASATRYITLTGSNGTSVFFNSSAGPLDFGTAGTTGLFLLNSTYIAAFNQPTGGAGNDVMLTHGENSSKAGIGLRQNADDNAMVFWQGTGPTERARINSSGYFKASNSGTYVGSTVGHHELYVSGTDATWNTKMTAASATAANNYGLLVSYTAAAPNGTGNEFLFCQDNAATRAYIRSNGGIGNYQANDVNLSDERVKQWYEPYVIAANDDRYEWTARFKGLWEGHKRMRGVWGVYKYDDQTHDDVNHGYTAQGVRGAFKGVADELVDYWDAKGSLLAVYTHDLGNITGAIVTELQYITDDHTTEITDLKRRVCLLEAENDELRGARKAA